MRPEAHRAFTDPKRVELLSKLYEAENDKIVLDTVTTPMYHQHLPMLAEHELINWSTENRNVVKKGKRFSELEPLFEVY